MTNTITWTWNKSGKTKTISITLKCEKCYQELKSIEVPKDKNMKDLRDFFITLKEFKAGDYFKKKEALEKFNLAKKIEKKASWDKALTQDYQRKILKNVINVEDGNILNASKKQLKQYDEFLFNFDNIKQDYYSCHSIDY